MGNNGEYVGYIGGDDLMINFVVDCFFFIVFFLFVFLFIYDLLSFCFVLDIYLVWVINLIEIWFLF